MKVRYTKCYMADCYIKETKKHWWSRWKIEMIGMLPVLYCYDNGKFYGMIDY